jgi:hypothetical protein
MKSTTTSFRLLISFAILFTILIDGKGQDNAKIKIDAEIRPRAEMRYGYRTLPQRQNKPAFLVSQRSRLNGFYQNSKLAVFLSIQDVRFWGEYDPRETIGTTQAFQAWAELPVIPKVSVKFGRQTLIYDNERLFAQNNWRQNGGSHDALNFKYRDSLTEADVVVAFNEKKEQIFGTDYPSKDFYKFLNVVWFSRKLSKSFRVNSINAIDGYQGENNTAVLNLRYTNGGRLDLFKGKFAATTAVYFQHGKNLKGQMVKAWYLQPEVKYDLSDRIGFRLGAEYFTGNDMTKKESVSRSFVPLYGVAHRFNGYLDYFIRFPDDYKEAGLINPYFFTSVKVGKKLTVRPQLHQFYLQNKYVYKGEVINKYLGFEADLLLNYKPNSFTDLEIGYSTMLPETSMEIIKGVSNSVIPHWVYVMITVKPVFFERN